MKRRDLLRTPLLWPAFATAQQAPLLEAHFPNRLYQFVWRNWELANLDRMAAVVRARPEQLQRMAREMGLPPKQRLSEDLLRRIYITTIRQNWFLLPRQQIVQLLGWGPEHFDFTLKEDDFLDVKLGRTQPPLDPLYWAEPTPEERRGAAAIRRILARHFPGGLGSFLQRPFAFTGELSALAPGPGWRIDASGAPPELAAAIARCAGSGRRVAITLEPGEGFRIVPEGAGVRIHAPDARRAIRALYHLRNLPEWPKETIAQREVWSPYYLYSYFALYGDPLMEGDAAGLPDGYLDRLAQCGVGGVWIQAVLHTLAPARGFPEFGKGHEQRLENLRRLVRRAAGFGLRVYLYLNEPRAMPEAFFRTRPELRGTESGGVYAMCTSAEPVRDWLRASLARVFGEVPGLGGIFTITMSENHTNCFSHGGAWGNRMPVADGCPRCSQRPAADVLAELLETMREGVRAGSASAEVLAYDWGWGSPLAAQLIPKLSRDTKILSISEWEQPVERGGVKTAVGEYSMSVTGPGPRATRNWALARRNGMQCVAKTQFNNTWEISAVPYIPVLPLVLEHCEKLAAAGVNGVMASWTCGGYPSPNLRAAAAYGVEPRPSRDAILRAEAERMYGAGAAEAMRAWGIFSEAFRMFPYGVSIYVLPLQHGPANLLRARPTGLKPGMILFPHDAYQAWKGAYPAQVVASQMAALAKRWAEGVAVLGPVAAKGGAEARLELAIARACHAHFASVANQVAFYLLRDGPQTADNKARMTAIARREIELARGLFAVAQAESRIGYEASNHYYYTPLALAEKVLNCEALIG